MAERRSISELVPEFNSSVKALLTKIEKKSRSEIDLANLDRLKKRISLLKREMGEHSLLHEAHNVFIQYANQIIEPDQKKRDDFFMNIDVRREVLKKHGSIDKKDEFIFSFVDSIRAHYRACSDLEKAEVYKLVRTMLECSIEYKIALKK